jgi:hypothetical protein
MVTMGILRYQGKITMVEPGIEPGTSWPLAHEAGRHTDCLNDDL